MKTLRPGVAAALAVSALVVTACGGNSEDKRFFNKRHSLCDAVVASGQTLAQAVANFGADGTVPVASGSAGCQTNLIAIPGRVDNCTYGIQPQGRSVCRFVVEWLAIDNDLCNNFQCFYFCELRTQDDGSGQPVAGAPVCGTDWESGQSG